MAAWALLNFFICLHNQLSSMHFIITYWLSLKRGMENGEWGLRLTIFLEILHSEQFEGAEFIDNNNFL